ncbi:hypothetical protein CRYUN_Cryun04dG0097200 [Craigia yunnanensis]
MPRGARQSIGYGWQTRLLPSSWTTPIKALNHSNDIFFLHVGLLMFSPTGQLTSYAHKGRIEDIFLRYIDEPDGFKGLFSVLTVLVPKSEAFEAHERKLCELNRQKYEAQDKMRYYNPDLTMMLSIPEANLHQQFVIDAIRRIEKLKKAKLLEKETSPSKPNDVEMPAVEVDSDSTTEESVNSKRKRNQSADDHKEEARLPGLHLSISYLKTQKNWNLENDDDIASSERSHVLENSTGLKAYMVFMKANHVVNNFGLAKQLFPFSTVLSIHCVVLEYNEIGIVTSLPSRMHSIHVLN